MSTHHEHHTTSTRRFTNRTGIAIVTLAAIVGAGCGSGTVAEESSTSDAPAQLVTDDGDQTSAVTESTVVESIETEPASTEPASTEPASTEPADTEPADTEPVATEDAGDLVSDFEAGVDGWRIEGDGTEPAHVSSGGRDDSGYIESSDRARGVTWYWKTPEGWAGDRSEFAGGSLSFDLRQSATDRQYDNVDIVLLDSAGNIIELTMGRSPDAEWTRYSLPLSGGAWNDRSTGEPFAEDAFRDILSDLAEIRIRGEYRRGADTGGLDNVRLSSTPVDEVTVDAG